MMAVREVAMREPALCMRVLQYQKLAERVLRRKTILCANKAIICANKARTYMRVVLHKRRIRGM